MFFFQTCRAYAITAARASAKASSRALGSAPVSTSGSTSVRVSGRTPGIIRRFAALAALLAVLSAFNAPEAQCATTLRFANFPGASTFPCISMERWADEIERRTGGGLLIETYPGGTLVEAKNMLRGVMQGQADIGCISLAYHPGAFPFMSVFELPLGFSSAESVTRAMLEVLEYNSPKELEKVKVIAVFSSPPSQILSTRALSGPDDLRGLSIRASGVPADTAAALGAAPVSMPQSDTPEALQKGVVQAVFTSFDVLMDYNFVESCRYGMRVDMPVYPMIFFMNMKKWNSLPPEMQAEIMALMPEHSVWTARYVDGHAQGALQWSVDNYGYSLVELDAAQKEALREKSRPVIDAWLERAAARGIDGKKLLEDTAAAKAGAEKAMSHE